MFTKWKMLFWTALLFSILLAQQVAFAGPVAPTTTPSDSPAEEAEEKPDTKDFIVPEHFVGGPYSASFGRCGIYFPDGLPVGTRIRLSKGHITSVQQNRTYNISSSIQIEIFDPDGNPKTGSVFAQVYCNMTPGEILYWNNVVKTGDFSKTLNFYKDGIKQHDWFINTGKGNEIKKRVVTTYNGPGTYFFGRLK